LGRAFTDPWVDKHSSRSVGRSSCRKTAGRLLTLDALPWFHMTVVLFIDF